MAARSAALLLTVPTLLLAATPPPAPAAQGVVVVRVAPGLAAEKAGLRPGDRLWRWAQGEARGTLASPFEVVELEEERGPRGPVQVEGERGLEPIAVSLLPGNWGLHVGASSTDPPDPDAAAWALLDTARAEAARGRPETAEAAIREALRAAGGGQRLFVQAQLWDSLGRILQEAEKRDQALAAFGKARAIRERLAPRSLALARALCLQARLSGFGEVARQLWRRALDLVEELAPESDLAARVLIGVASTTDDLAGRVELRRRAVAIRERLAPDSPELVWDYYGLASALGEAGERAAGEAEHRRALAIVERVAPGTPWYAETLYLYGKFYARSGDLAQAEALYRRALEITERAGGQGPLYVEQLRALGVLLAERRELDLAESYLRRCVEVQQRRDEKHPVIGQCLQELATLARQRGDAARAESLLRRALSLLSRNPKEMGVRFELGHVLADSGRVEEAEALFRQAVELYESIPRSLSLAHGRAALGGLAVRRGDLEAAERHYRAALDLSRELDPGGAQDAEASHALGRVRWRRGSGEEALGLFLRAAEARESLSARLGGSAAASTRFRAQYQQAYRDLEELLLELGRREEAFRVVERARARGLLALLAGRDLGLGKDAPEAAERERRQADAEYDRLLQQLNGRHDGQGEELRRKLQEARLRQEDARARLRAAAPRVAAVRDPQPLDLPGVRRVLDPGTLLLAYSLGPSSSRVYAVGPGRDDFAVFELGAGEGPIRREVERFREGIERRRGSMLRRDLEAQSHRLGQRLLGPVARLLAAAERVLVVPDGVLHRLPFAALGDPSSPRSSRYLVETKPVHVAASVTLYAQLTPARRETDRPLRVVGFGDPAYPRPSAGDAERPALRRALGNGLSFERLPATRRELEALQALAPQSARLWLGTDATEERAKSLGRDVRVVHFATHGFTDEAFPLESGLALSIPSGWAEGKENGLLQAWEVFESLRLDADLVTLSACRTAQGKEVAGEGLLGLTWAFQYAGARSVLASLWEVNDASTAELMRRFYGHLRAGLPKVEALRRAQVELRRRPATSAPYFWAPFVLAGDWR